MEDLIYDRTEEDVVYAKLNPNCTKKLKGALNYTDLNRIEIWSLYIQELLNSIGIQVEVNPVKNYQKMTYNDLSHKNYSLYLDLNYTSLLNFGGWKNTDSITISQMNKMRTNIDNLKKAFHINSNINIEYLKNLDYKQINILEQILKELKDNVENVTKNKVYSGIFYCGEQYVPY